jgi:hypothetical protein
VPFRLLKTSHARISMAEGVRLQSASTSKSAKWKLWTGRIDHFADGYSVAPADTVVSATPKDNARRLTAIAQQYSILLLMHRTFALSQGVRILVFHLSRTPLSTQLSAANLPIPRKEKEMQVDIEYCGM